MDGAIVGCQRQDYWQYGDSCRYHGAQAGRGEVAPAGRTFGPGPRCYYRPRPGQPHRLLEFRGRGNLWLGQGRGGWARNLQTPAYGVSPTAEGTGGRAFPPGALAG